MKTNLNNIKVIKWYQYDAEGLQQQLYEARLKRYNKDEDYEQAEEPVAQESSQPITNEAYMDAGSNTTTDDGVNLDDEVARIMAAFTNAKQNGVDSVFQSLNETPSSSESEEDLIASICAPRQNNVDALVAGAR